MDAPHAAWQSVDMLPSESAPSPLAPRAPSAEAWRALTEAERAAWLQRLGPIPAREALPPEGDAHLDAWLDANDALGNWFRAKKRRAYIGRGLTVYYPEEPRFAPDLFVVLEAEPGRRSSWVVSHEGRGLDFALEVYVSGDKRKDSLLNVARYARLGIPEYFLYDAVNCSLTGYRLPAGATKYVPIVPQMGRWPSEVLGLTLGISDRRLRFFDELHVIPFERELNQELMKALNEAEVARMAQAEARAEAEAARMAEATARAEAEVARMIEATGRAEAEARADALQAELTSLRAQLRDPSPG